MKIQFLIDTWVLKETYTRSFDGSHTSVKAILIKPETFEVEKITKYKKDGYSDILVESNQEAMDDGYAISLINVPNSLFTIMPL